MKIFKNRIVVGVICIVAAFAISFGIAPLTNRILDSRIEVLRMKNTVEAGQPIYAEDLEVVTVGSYNIASGILSRKEDIVGTYARSTIYAGDYVTYEKVTESNASCDSVLQELGGLSAMSITVKNYAAGMSGKLKNGDIISLIVYKDGETFIPEELEEVRVITTTTDAGLDVDEVGENVKPTTITVLVSVEQAKALALYENSGSMHVMLVRRDPFWNDSYFVVEEGGSIYPEGYVPENTEQSENRSDVNNESDEIENLNSETEGQNEIKGEQKVEEGIQNTEGGDQDE